MVADEHKPPLLILGVHTKCEGNPNTLYRLHELVAADVFDVSEINVPLIFGMERPLDSLHPMKIVWGAFVAHLSVFLRYMLKKTPSRAYVPYPAVFVLVLLSFLPRFMRPRLLIADAFISFYDTLVNDRHLLRVAGLVARCLYALEKRAYNCADILVVDTPQNAVFFQQLFSLSAHKLEPLPLAINEADFGFKSYLPDKTICQVLFIGTMIPLHGVDTIAHAAILLASRHDIRFKFIGDGQDARFLQDKFDDNRLHLEWTRKWLSSAELAEAIGQADICLGIFGAGDKTQRVCPIKLYAYASVGRTAITGDTLWLREATRNIGYKPFASVPVNDPQALAGMIASLADDPVKRSQYAANASKFYHESLANKVAMTKLLELLKQGA